jgi:predicted RNA binding protein YcfA (HicA-like mRNA interferase family)
VSGRLPAGNGRRATRAPQQHGFIVDRIVVSRHLLRHRDDPARLVTVPFHGSRALEPGTIRSIIWQAGLTPEEFARLP